MASAVAAVWTLAWSENGARPRRQSNPVADWPALKVVDAADLSGAASEELARLIQSIEKLQSHADELDRAADQEEKASAGAMRVAAANCRRLVSTIRRQIDSYGASRSLH